MTAADLRELSRKALIRLILTQQDNAALERTIAVQSAETDVLKHQIRELSSMLYWQSSEKSRGDRTPDDGAWPGLDAADGRSGDDAEWTATAPPSKLELRSSPDCPQRVIPVLPPEAERLSEDQ